MTLATMKSITNATSFSHTQAGDYYTQMYPVFTGEGYTVKLAYMYLVTSIVKYNGTYLFNGTLQMPGITLITGQGQSQSVQSPQIRAFDYNSNKTFVYMNDPNSWNQEMNDIALYNWRGGGGSSNTITIHWYGLIWPTGAHIISITAYFYYILPNGSVGSVTRTIYVGSTS